MKKTNKHAAVNIPFKEVQLFFYDYFLGIPYRRHLNEEISNLDKNIFKRARELGIGKKRGDIRWQQLCDVMSGHARYMALIYMGMPHNAVVKIPDIENITI